MVSVAVFVMAPFLIYEKARPVERERERDRGGGGKGPAAVPALGGEGGLSPDIANAALAPLSASIGLPLPACLASFGSSLKRP